MTKEVGWEKEFIEREAVAVSVFADGKTMDSCIKFAENRAKTEKDSIVKLLEGMIKPGYEGDDVEDLINESRNSALQEAINLMKGK